MATNSAAGNGAIQSPAFSPTANPTFASQGQTPPSSSSSSITNTNQGAPLSSEAKAQILGTSDASTAGSNDAKEGGGGGGKGASEHAPGSSAQEQGVAAEEGWNEEVKDLERRMGDGQGGSGLGR
ncbi:hypothetical protein GE21DRAFT_1581 [Neurospora crassa]|uniref:Uncharacterized protein n=1 Tax=Neurospora crassa (strain ATCC 24698 / 74-OR23-1A / CBS 708.71 / DSM 1257 / FGSC 987) TaxID=367110 RepID=Q7S1F0_NEUCR|nr:hypothetical protein NCU07424 [Neurospora crassa OR74A]EAA29189.1 hypothetical protein NCU07424 [Neurospora crassa OR74A]KHE82599.1 hypothetical protein GE21DRAFT_1581 [Neurospora crassa]|eukprot:XP_958425.1 hypothetical protein NCU07424 [Neurospora crassa OR74A]